MQLVRLGENEQGDTQPVRPFTDEGGSAYYPDSKESDSSEAQFLALAMDRMQAAIHGWQDNFDLAKEDLAFIGGEQWDSADVAMRRQQRRPVLTFNKMQTNIDLVTGRQRKQRTSINLVQRTVGEDVESHYHIVNHLQDNEGMQIQSRQGEDPSKTMKSLGGNKLKPSEVFEGLIRNIEYQSRASNHYSIAGTHAAESGFGWLRVRSDYRSRKTFDQDLIIESIQDRFSVLMDPYCQQPDCSDADFCFIRTNMSRENFLKKYPKANAMPMSFPDLTDENDRMMNAVGVTEYYWREEEQKTLVSFSDGKIVYKDELTPDAMMQLKQMGVTPVDMREVTVPCVYWALITPAEVLEAKRSWPGERVPVIPVFGKIKYINAKRYYVGLCTNAKDAQRAYNLARSATVDTINTSTRAKWLADKRSIDPQDELVWANATDPSITVLPYNSMNGVAAPTPIQVTQTPIAELQVALATSDDIKSTTGIFDASLGAKGNETSGVAIQGRQQQGDDITYIFQDNLDMSIEGIGRVLLDAIPIFYDTERTVRTMGSDGSEDFIQINSIKEGDGHSYTINDLSKAEFDISVETKPYSDSQKVEAANGIVNILKAFPDFAPLIGDLALRMQDNPFSDEMADRVRRSIPKNILEDPDPTAPPDPQQAAAAAMQQKQLELEGAKIDAENATAQSKIVTAKANAFKAQHETARAFAPQPAAGEGKADAKGEKDEKSEPAEEKTKEIVMEVISELMKAGVLGQPQAAAAPPMPANQPQQ